MLQRGQSGAWVGIVYLFVLFLACNPVLVLGASSEFSEVPRTLFGLNCMALIQRKSRYFIECAIIQLMGRKRLMTRNYLEIYSSGQRSRKFLAIKGRAFVGCFPLLRFYFGEFWWQRCCMRLLSR